MLVYDVSAKVFDTKTKEQVGSFDGQITMEDRIIFKEKKAAEIIKGMYGVKTFVTIRTMTFVRKD